MAKYYSPFLSLDDKPIVEEIKGLLEKKLGNEFRFTDKGVISKAIKLLRDELKKELEG